MEYISHKKAILDEIKNKTMRKLFLHKCMCVYNHYNHDSWGI